MARSRKEAEQEAILAQQKRKQVLIDGSIIALAVATAIGAVVVFFWAIASI
jgi:hypothetical protein